MKRPFIIVLADAFDRAAHDVFVAPQVHAACDDPAPTVLENWSYWWRGFFAGLACDSHSTPLTQRFVNISRKTFQKLMKMTTKRRGVKR